MIKKFFWNFIGLTVGCVIYAFGFATMISPNNLAPGGVTGIAVILREVLPFEISTGAIVLAINIPLLIIGTIFFGKKFFAGTVYATVASSALMSLIEYLIESGHTWLVLSNDLMLCALAGGAAVGLGIGIIFRFGSTTGGSDIVVKILRLKFRHIRTGVLFIIFDTTVVTISAFVFHNVDLALYATISLIVTSVVIDMVLYGSDTARLVFIISDKNDLIAGRLLEELDVGATYIKGVGAYTKENKTVLMAAVKKQIFPKVKTIVCEVDETSFMIVSSANEIFGEGFKLHGSAEL
ncbi:MAG: YitT family protein [Clostridia bacterium]|nr:YitT family protein [Clostridia bacterium]